MGRTGLIVNRETKPVRTGGCDVRIAQVLLTEVSDTQTCHLAEHAGEESNPPDGSLATVLAVSPAFKQVIAVDDGISPVMAVGGKRVYSIDPDAAETVAEVRLLPTGEIQVFNSATTITVAPGGAVTVDASDAVTINATGLTVNCDVAIEGNLEASGYVKGDTVIYDTIDARTHVHTDSTGGTTGVPE